MSKLYVVPTPIGNLDDITLRAVRVLSDVDLILAEDTRTTQVLLRHLGIEKRMWSHHKFNEHSAVEAVARTIESGEAVALVSDAGTPGISDPGFLLVRTCLEHGIEIETLPRTMIFYESPYRLTKTLEQFAGVFGAERPVSVSRELTKKFEQTVRGTLAEVAAHFAAHEPKGEIVVVLGGRPRREAGADGPAASGRDSADINSMGL